MAVGTRKMLSTRQRDLVSGALCIAAGIGVLIEARKDTIGSLDQSGPGFYPAVLGTLLTLVDGPHVGSYSGLVGLRACWPLPGR